MITLTFLFTIATIATSCIFLALSKNYYYIILVLGLSPVIFYIMAGLSVCIVLFILCLLNDKTYKLNYMLVRSILKFFAMFVYFFKVKRVDNIKIPNEKLLLVGNHKAKLDAIFLIIATKTPITFTPKEELYKSSILRFIFKKLRTVKIYRDDIRKTIISLNKAKENMIKDNLRYIVFPETGTQNRENEKMTDTKPAAYKLALMSSASLMPFSIKNNLGFHKFYKKTILVKYHDVIEYKKIKDLQTDKIDELVKPIVNEWL